MYNKKPLIINQIIKNKKKKIIFNIFKKYKTLKNINNLLKKKILLKIKKKYYINIIKNTILFETSNIHIKIYIYQKKKKILNILKLINKKITKIIVIINPKK